MVRLDIWNNLTYLIDGDVWYEQTFFENELIKYEDSKGNYWAPEYGEFPFLKLKYIHKEPFFDLVLEVHPKDDILEVAYRTIRKLRATWSPEMAQDLTAFYDIDAEAELTALLSEQIAIEIDREMMNRVFNIEPLIL